MKLLIFSVITGFFLATAGLANTVIAADYDWMKKQDLTTEDVPGKKLQNQYVMFRGGWYLPDKPSGMNIGTGAEAGYGIQPLKWLAAEATFGFIETNDYDDNLNNMHRTIQMVPITATIRAILPFNQFDLYALAGGGVYYTMLKYDNVNQEPAADTGDKTLYGYQYGIGAALKTGGSSVGVEVRQIVTSWNAMDISGTFVTAFFRYGL
jgi:hypothetical protein